MLAKTAGVKFLIVLVSKTDAKTHVHTLTLHAHMLTLHVKCAIMAGDTPALTSLAPTHAHTQASLRPGLTAAGRLASTPCLPPLQVPSSSLCWSRRWMTPYSQKHSYTLICGVYTHSLPRTHTLSANPPQSPRSRNTNQASLRPVSTAAGRLASTPCLPRLRA